MAIKEDLDKFSDWVKQNSAYLGKVKVLLSDVIPDQEELIIGHVRLVEAHYARVGCLLADVNGWLNTLTGECMKDESIAMLKTVREREIETDRLLSQVKSLRGKIQVLLDAIELRVNLSQSILKQQRVERKLQ